MLAELLFSLKLEEKALVLFLNFVSQFWSMLTLVVKGGKRDAPVRIGRCLGS